MNQIGIFKANAGAVIPNKMTEGSACFDLAACIVGDDVGEIVAYNENSERVFMTTRGATLSIPPGYRVLVPTGIIMDIPEGYSVRLHPRSSLAWKHGLMLANNEGVIDSDYVEPVFALIYNFTEAFVDINHGDRIVQCELAPVVPAEFAELEARPAQKTSRDGGLGSTGKQ